MAAEEATSNTTHNFPHGLGDPSPPSWNPALRPDHESPRKPSFDASVDAKLQAQHHTSQHDALAVVAEESRDGRKPVVEDDRDQIENEVEAEDVDEDEDDLPVRPAAPESFLPEEHSTDAPSWASHSQSHLKDDYIVPTSDDDFFDRYGQPELAPSSVAPAHPLSSVAISRGGGDVADNAWANEDLAEAPEDEDEHEHAPALVNGTRQEDVEVIAEKHSYDNSAHPVSHDWDHAIHDRPAENMYEHQGKGFGLEDVVQEHAATPLVAMDTAAGDDWGASDDWQIGHQAEAQSASANADAFSFEQEATETSQFPTLEFRQPDISAAVFSTDESVLATQDVHLAADTTQHLEQPTHQHDAERDITAAVSAVPAAAQESSQDEWGTAGDSAFDLSVTSTDDFLEGATSAVTKEVNAAPADDLADAWAAAMGDEDFLPGTDAAAAFGFDDGEGFLDDKVAELTPAKPAVVNRHKRAQSVTKYTPPNVPQAGLPPPTRGGSYRPDAPNFVDLSKSQQAAAAATAATAATTRAPVASPYQSAYQQAAERPAVTSAVSFVDKAKGGYQSPFDLPDDLAVKRRRPVVTSQASAPNVQQVAPPPRLSSMQSMPSMGPPKQQTPTTPSFPGASPAVSQGPYGTSPTTSQPPKPLSRDGGFFADLPITARPPRQGTPSRAYTPQPAVQPSPLAPPAQIRPASTSYLPQQPPANLGTMPHLQPAERIPLYSDDVQSQQRSTTMPPPPSGRYSPAVPAAQKSNYSAAPPAPAASASRYSPAPGAKQTPSVPRQASDVSVGLSRSQAQLYAPRTSSPLAFHSVPAQDQSSVTTPPSDAHFARSKASQDRMGSMASISGLETVNENAEPTFSPPGRPDGPRHPPPPSSRNSTPPPSRSQPSSGVSSPRKRGIYAPTNYQPMAVPTDQAIVPPRRSQTSSPSAAMKHPHIPLVPFERPASVAALQSPIQTSFVKPQNRIVSSSLSGPAYHEMNNLVPPQDASAQDPLQRWKGAPVFRWGNGNSIVTTFPRYAPMYGTGSIGPVIKPTPGEIKTGVISTVCPQSDIFVKFPGPLKKGKKKEVLAWLKSSADQLEAEHKTASMNGELTTAKHTRSEERVLLWRVMTLLVEHDGLLEGSPTVEAAVRTLIAPSVPDPVSATDETDPLRVNIQPEAFDPLAVKALRTHLYAGEREKAVWHAVDQRLWAHALLVASTLNDKEIWKQVVQEFVRKEVRKIGENTEALAALYQVFAGNWEESIDELVSVSARSGFQMVSTASGGGSQKDALAGLDRWRETLLLVLNNRSTGDAAALASLGNLLNGYGRVEAGHICFLFARTAARFAGADDQQAHFSLIGGTAAQQGSDFGYSLDTILLSEVYEFAMMTVNAPTLPIPHLQAYKLYHAEVLAEAGKRTEAQQYCDAITNIVTTKANRSPYYNAQFMRWLDDFARRLSQAPTDRSDSSWKPSIDKVSSSIWGKFNNFIAGEADAPDTTTPPSGDVVGNFAPVVPVQMPSLGRTASSDAYGGYQPQTNGHAVASPPANSRYAPGAPSYTPRSSSEQQTSRYTTQSQSGYDHRASLDSTRSTYEPRNSNEYGVTASPQYNAAPPGSSHSMSSPYTPAGGIHTPSTSYASDALGLQQQPLGSPYVPSPLNHGATEPLQSHSPAYLPTPPMEQSSYAGANGYAPVSPPEVSSFDDESPPQQQSYGYEPPTSGYEPPVFQPYQPDNEDELPGADGNDENKPKKKSFMDDDDDDEDFAARAAALKKKQKSEADRLADEAFKKAAEADAAKAAASSSGRSRGSWFGGWFAGGSGGKEKDLNAPVVHKAKLGEESSFYFDNELGRWVNKKAGAETATPVAATPPPPKSVAPPSRPASAMMPPPVRVGSPAKSASPVSVASGPPPLGGGLTRSASAQLPLHPPQAGPVAALSGGPPSRPPSRPHTSMSNASDIDDLLGPAAPRKGGAKKSARKGRYVDVMAQK